MSAAIIVLVPMGLSAYTLALTWSLAAANVAGAAIILCLLGGLLRRYAIVVAGAFVALANYGVAVFITDSVELWPSLGVGVALFLLLEAAYDWIVLLRVAVRSGKAGPSFDRRYQGLSGKTPACEDSLRFGVFHFA